VERSWPVADQEGLVAGLGVGEAGEDGVHQVGRVNQAAPGYGWRRGGGGSWRRRRFSRRAMLPGLPGAVDQGGRRDGGVGEGGGLAKLASVPAQPSVCYGRRGYRAGRGRFRGGGRAGASHGPDGANEDDPFNSGGDRPV
jgi:hypothetical protein